MEQYAKWQSMPSAGTAARVTEETLQDCERLFSGHHGRWSERPGQHACPSGSPLQMQYGAQTRDGTHIGHTIVAHSLEPR